MEQGDFVVRAVAGLRRHELENGHAVKGPAVARGHQPKLGLAFGERDVENLFAPLHAFEEKLECERGLARSRRAFDEIKPIGVKPAAQNVIQARHARRDSLAHFGLNCVHEDCPARRSGDAARRARLA